MQDKSAAIKASQKKSSFLPRKETVLKQTNKKKPIVVGMSGGIDSSMSLVLLKKQGWRPIGVSLKLPVWKNKQNLLRENIRCTKQSLALARAICKKLNVPHYILDVRNEFKKEVIDYFIRELKANRTPNPCIVCNRHLKFKELFRWAEKHHIKYVATGHYAQIRKNQKTGKYELLRARDKEKDQTYSLCLLPQKWLKHIVFPLGKYKKEEVYKMAKEMGLGLFLKRKPSQDFCFLAGKSLNQFLTKEIEEKPGQIKDDQGNTLGKHKGLCFYTIGQRKGINLPGGPYFVKNFDPKKNILFVTKRKKELLEKTVFLSPIHFISIVPPKREISVTAKIRYRQPLSKARLCLLYNRKAKLIFNKPQIAPTPGQFAVFYNRNVCLGAGKITKKL